MQVQRKKAIGSGWPRPTATTSGWASVTALGREHRRLKKQGRWTLGTRLWESLTPKQRIHGGFPNPMWVEWLMGWPIGWTNQEPLETDKFLRWLRLHGRC